MATSRKKNSTFMERVPGLNLILDSVDLDIEKALRQARRQGKRSVATLRKRVDGLMTNINTNELLERGEGLRKEIERITRGVKNQIEDGVWENVIDRIRDNVTATVDAIQDLEVVELAKEKVQGTKNTVFSALNIPSSSDIRSLSRKVVALEKKLDAIKKHEVRH